MLKIAVCDDNPEHLKNTMDSLRLYFLSRPALFGQAVPFENGRSLLKEIAGRGGFDLYLLDIIMPEFNGIQTGLNLRSMGDGGEIIYLTNSNEYASDSYDVRAFFIC